MEETNKYKITKKLKCIFSLNNCLIILNIFILGLGTFFIIQANDSLNSIYVSIGTGLLTSGIVSLLVEIIHIISSHNTKQNLKALFYSDVKKFIAEFLYYSSFLLDKSNLKTIEMLEYQSEQYKSKYRKFNRLTREKQIKIMDDVHYLVKQRKNFKFFLNNINNRLYASAINGIIDIEIEKLLENIIYDYNWIVEIFNDNRITEAVPDTYHFLLNSVKVLIEKDNNLSFFKFIEYYSIKENSKDAGFVKKEYLKKIDKKDLSYLHYFKQI